MKNKKLFLCLVIGIILFLILSNNVQANVQSRPNATSLRGKNVSSYFALIRQMETTSGPMGLSAIVDDTGTETSNSNDIDVHMIKNTEWGTVAMLSVSSYGSKPQSNNNYSTTGNAYGVYQMLFSGGTQEIVAGMWNVSNNYNTNLYNAESKYWDKYEEKKNKIGDATLETEALNDRNDYADFVSEKYPVFWRGYFALFSYGKSNGSGDYNSRAAVVNGIGL